MRAPSLDHINVRILRALAWCAFGVSLVAAAARCAPPVIVTSEPAPARPRPDSTRVATTPPTPPPTTPPVAPPATPPRTAPLPRPIAVWPVRVHEHVDLWLHGFAMLQEDSTLVPYFQPHYRRQLLEMRSPLRLTTQLDLNTDRLRTRLVANPGVIAAQFVPLYFASWEELRQAADLFLRLDGDPRGARDRRSGQLVATFGAYFPAAADREWLRLFLSSLDDERVRFYDQYWRETQRARGAVFDAVDRLWRQTVAARFERFLNNSQQRDGEILLSLPLAGEGRTLTPPTHLITVAVGFPDDTAKAAEMVYAFAHEIVGSMANAVVTDNTSPAERRSGAADRYSSLAAVRGGAMLLARVAPDLAPGYMAYYLSLARRPASGGDVERSFAATFALPDGLRDALRRQIYIILGGI